MIGIYKFLHLLQGQMERPQAFGWFHLLWICFVIVSLIILFERRNKFGERQLKLVLGIYGIVALILEVLKQLIWSVNYDISSGIVIWDYQWYAFPFQLCTTPIYVSLICLFLKRGKFRDNLLSYLAYVTILGSIAMMIMPVSCFTRDILVNIHTMWLHLGSFVVSIYLLINGEVKISFKALKKAIFVFLIFMILANSMNIIVYNLGILGDEVFNMFYISPYFASSLPVFDVIWQHVPYLIFLLIYGWAIIIGSLIIYGLGLFFKKISNLKY